MTAALEELGLADSTLSEALTKSLELSVDTVLVQGGKQAVYGSIVKPSFDSDSDNEILDKKFTKPYAKRPESCPICGQSSHTFRNLGIVKQKGNTEIENSNVVAKIKSSEDFEENRVSMMTPSIKNSVKVQISRFWKCKKCQETFITST